MRLINGGTLPTDGLTVASQNPVYIQGDYNTTSASTRGSAAVFADAVTILSNNWKDINSSGALEFSDSIQYHSEHRNRGGFPTFGMDESENGSAIRLLRWTQ